MRTLSTSGSAPAAPKSANVARPIVAVLAGALASRPCTPVHCRTRASASWGLTVWSLSPAHTATRGRDDDDDASFTSAAQSAALLSGGALMHVNAAPSPVPQPNGTPATTAPA